MNRELINRIEITDMGEVFLGLEGAGQGEYQYVYREAAGVYWDPGRCGFKSTPMRDWSCSKWYSHIIEVVRSGLGVELSLAEDVAWSNVGDDERNRISRGDYS